MGIHLTIPSQIFHEGEVYSKESIITVFFLIVIV